MGPVGAWGPPWFPPGPGPGAANAEPEPTPSAAAPRAPAMVPPAMSFFKFMVIYLSIASVSSTPRRLTS
ncbi:hypothetical protein BST11_12345 [Mycobacterium alsense]|uniref:Uncharacterized protein n=1 Tax=Mycobacterium alsense TaxID=324058 RepID=A0ABX3R9H2_9MYCO|nr:hypothetical protein BST11_12345 [Mycobacterium alsense]